VATRRRRSAEARTAPHRPALGDPFRQTPTVDFDALVAKQSFHAFGDAGYTVLRSTSSWTGTEMLLARIEGDRTACGFGLRCSSTGSKKTDHNDDGLTLADDMGSVVACSWPTSRAR